MESRDTLIALSREKTHTTPHEHLHADMTDMTADATTPDGNRKESSSDRPLGITLLCAMNSLVIVLLLLVSLAIHPVAFFMVLVVSSIDIAKIYLLWTMHPAGWWVAMVLYAFGLFMGLAHGELLKFIFAGVVLAYLWTIREVYLAQD